MTTTNDTNEMSEADSFGTLQHTLSNLGWNLRDAWQETWVNFRNWRRQTRDAQLDYVVLTLGGSYPERDGPSRNFIQRRLPLPTPPLSMQGFNRRLQQIADAENVRGVVFTMRPLSVGMGTLQNLRQSLERLRAAGKEVVVYTPMLDMRHYFVATAADRIIVPPSARFDALGLYSEVTFLKDALARAGVAVNVIQISPYKTALDRLGQSDLTPEYREQLGWLLDEQYDLLTAAMAAGRSLPQETLQAYINQSPLTVEQAHAYSLIDDVAYDDELPVLLSKAMSPKETDSVTESDKPSLARLETWSKARRILLEKHRQKTERFVGVISLEGAIVMGPSRAAPINLPIPFIGDQSLGEQTAVSLLRKAEKLDDLAAVILHVDSGGGSALASDLIARQVALLSRKKPVLVYMGNIAASGGYYIAAPGQSIMSQSGTLTGSIGVIMAHVATTGLLDMLSVNRTVLKRGDHAGLYTNTEVLDDETRGIYWKEINHTYEQFKDVVAAGRRLPVESLDPICEGRVWTGRQAKDLGLVDAHGDFVEAIVRAAELGNIPTDDVAAISVANLHARDSSYVVPASDAAELAAQVRGLVTGEMLREWSGRPLALMPFDLRFY